MTDNEKKIIKSALEILYNINHTINLMESIGIMVEGNNNDDHNIGGDLYKSSTVAYTIIEDIMQFGPEKVMKIDEAIEILYIEDDSMENKINKCLKILINLKENKEITKPFTIVDGDKFKSTSYPH